MLCSCHWRIGERRRSNDEVVDLCKIQDSLKNSVKAPVTIYINQVVEDFHAQTKQTESSLDFRDTVLKIESTTYTHQSHPLCVTTLSRNPPNKPLNLAWRLAGMPTSRWPSLVKPVEAFCVNPNYLGSCAKRVTFPTGMIRTWAWFTSISELQLYSFWPLIQTSWDIPAWKNWERVTNLIGSMGLVYLPTFTIKIN